FIAPSSSRLNTPLPPISTLFPYTTLFRSSLAFWLQRVSRFHPNSPVACRWSSTITSSTQICPTSEIIQALGSTVVILPVVEIYTLGQLLLWLLWVIVALLMVTRTIVSIVI